MQLGPKIFENVPLSPKTRQIDSIKLDPSIKLFESCTTRFRFHDRFQVLIALESFGNQLHFRDKSEDSHRRGKFEDFRRTSSSGKRRAISRSLNLGENFHQSDFDLLLQFASENFNACELFVERESPGQRSSCVCFGFGARRWG